MSNVNRFVAVAGVIALGSLAQAGFINPAAPAASQGPSASQAAFPASNNQGVTMTSVVVDADALANIPMGLNNAGLFVPQTEMGAVESDTGAGVSTLFVPAPGAIACFGLAGLAAARRRR